MEKKYKKQGWYKRGGPAREKENYRTALFMETKVKKKRDSK